MAAKIASLKIKAEWERWLTTHHPGFGSTPDLPTNSEFVGKSRAGSAPPAVFNEVLWMAVKRQWRLRLAAQQLPSQGDQGDQE